ncbi:segregation/condensation protein A [Arthrobacter sp. AK01]|uniref:segregation and condensation protein A n=1 Tax=Micrococcaceae TaxID=1268 RepID=UPI001E32D60A|nr:MULTISPECIES: ScpA family protein [Micrococcaceae]MCD4850165.1 segregation/condensation protein A [Arthrobacter sp. AK01]MCP1413401.1 segregation and condensation protein A [Paenarthrobacter sp. A20]
MGPSLAPTADAGSAVTAEAPDAGTSEGRKAGFEVRLANFTGPFDLLLGLISKHKLDITEVALATVTDEFIKYIRRLQELGEDWALDEASEFLVIAATLLDLKAARLLPAGEVEDAEDIALLEARDLLFARLLQYKAFKQIAGIMGETLEQEARRYPRQVALEGHFAALLPELVWRHTPGQFAELAAKALKPKDAAPAEVGLDHLHAPPVSVKEQAEIMGYRLKLGAPLSFQTLIADAATTLVVVARFLALLEMFRDRVVAFEQPGPLAELTVRWTGDDAGWDSSSLNEEYEAGPDAGSGENTSE